MLYSKTCEYSLRSLAYLSTKPRKSWTRITEISEQTGVPGPYISKIFQGLVVSGILNSSRGAYGGFSFRVEPSRLSLMDIVKAIDAEKPWEDCVMGLNECNDRVACPVHEIWKAAKEKMTKKFKTTRLDKLSEKIKDSNFRDLQRTRINVLKI